MNVTGPVLGTSSASIRAQVKRELESEKRSQSQAQRLSQVYSPPREVNLEGAPVLAVEGVFFRSAVTGDVVLPRDEMQAHIKEFLYSQLEEEPQLTSALMIYTLNKDPDKIKTGVETLCKYLDNIISNPGDDKFKKIRVNNKVFQERIQPLEGTETFLQAAGFTPKSLQGPNETPEDFLVISDEYATDTEKLESLKEILLTAEPIKPELDRNLKVYIASQHSAPRMEVPREFYNISPEELKREQQAKTEAVERLGMLRTKEMRERERIRELRKYRYSLIRVRFPDNSILQGTFRATDKFSAVMEFVRDNINLDWIPFVLSSQTGVKYKDEELTLAELDLAPAAIVGFAYDPAILSDARKQGIEVCNYLKVDVLKTAVAI